MCRTEETSYIGSDGQRRTFRDTFECDEARRRGEACYGSDKRTSKHRGVYGRAPGIARDDPHVTTSPLLPKESASFNHASSSSGSSIRRTVHEGGFLPENVTGIGGPKRTENTIIPTQILGREQDATRQASLKPSPYVHAQPEGSYGLDVSDNDFIIPKPSNVPHNTPDVQPSASRDFDTLFELDIGAYAKMFDLYASERAAIGNGHLNASEIIDKTRHRERESEMKDDMIPLLGIGKESQLNEKHSKAGDRVQAEGESRFLQQGQDRFTDEELLKQAEVMAKGPYKAKDRSIKEQEVSGTEIRRAEEGGEKMQYQGNTWARAKKSLRFRRNHPPVRTSFRGGRTQTDEGKTLSSLPESYQISTKRTAVEQHKGIDRAAELIRQESVPLPPPTMANSMSAWSSPAAPNPNIELEGSGVRSASSKGACLNCRKRKETACDRKTPCTPCIDHYQEELLNHPCSYNLDQKSRARQDSAGSRTERSVLVDPHRDAVPFTVLEGYSNSGNATTSNGSRLEYIAPVENAHTGIVPVVDSKIFTEKENRFMLPSSTPELQEMTRLLNREQLKDDFVRRSVNIFAAPRSESRSMRSTVVEDDNSSLTMYSKSTFSMISPQSTDIDFLRDRGYTVDDIYTFTKRVGQLFHQERSQQILYACALRNPAIGPTGLEHNLRHSFKECAEDLEGEAKDELEHLVARLIAHQANLLAKMIVSRYVRILLEYPHAGDVKEELFNDEEPTEVLGKNASADSLAIDMFLGKTKALQRFRNQIEMFASPNSALNTDRDPKPTAAAPGPHDDQPLPPSESSSAFKTKFIPTEDWQKLIDWDDETYDPLFQGDNNVGDDLFTFNTYTPESDISDPLEISSAGPSYNTAATKMSYPENWESRQVSAKDQDNIDFASENLSDPELLQTHDISSSSTKPKTPLLVLRTVHLKWQCRCDKTFTSSVLEQRENGIEEFVDRIQRSIGSKVTVTRAPNPANSSQATLIYQQLNAHLRSAILKLTSRSKRQSAGTLPQHSNGPTVTTTSLPSCVSSQPRMLHLLACMHANRSRKLLSQDRVESVTCDRKLFTFMRDKHARRGGRTWLIPSLNEVKGIFFVKFRLPLGGSVEVRHHNPCCSPSACECIPPKDRVEPSTRAEYRCIPGPPSVWPPVDPQYMAHLFNEPSCVNENDTWILDQLPRRICGELHGKAGQPAEGWGLYYQESLNWRLITLIMMVVFIMVSLFGILWAYLKKDIQGAFGVSSYLFAACGVFVSLIAVKSDKA